MNETYEKDGIYELCTGDFIDLSNLVTVGKVRFSDCRWGRNIDEIEPWGFVYFEGIFRLVKEKVRFSDHKQVRGEEEIEERKKSFEVEHQKLISAWKKFKEANK